jgi:signal transduction histidine kinase
LRKAIDEARRMIGGLRPPIIDEQGIVAAIDYLVSELKARGVQIHFHHALERDRLPALIENTLFRIVQEALVNLERHSKSDFGTIELVQTNGVARVTIADQGIGFDPAAVTDGHFGVQGIRERARLMGGVADIRSAPGKGTRIDVEVPVLSE